MLIAKAIKELLKEDESEQIFIEKGGFKYDFEFGIDSKGRPIIVLMKLNEKGTTNPEPTKEELADRRLKEENLGITDSWSE